MSSATETILFLDQLSDKDLELAAQERERTGVEFRVMDSDRPVIDQLSNVTAIVTRAVDISAHVIDGAPNLKYIMFEDFGSASIDQEAASSHGIPVITLVNLGWLGVSEHTMMFMLALSKKLPDAHARTAAGDRKPGTSEVKTTAREYTFSWLGQEDLGWLYRKRLGLIGAGRIARGVAARAQAFGMRIRYFAPHQASPEVENQFGMSYSPMDELLEWADFVSLHAKLTPESAMLIGEREFAIMRPDSYFINTARGGLVDEGALIQALSSGQIAGAGLDVFEYEPFQRDNPLTKLPNVILTPHSAGIFNDDARVAQIKEAFDRVRERDAAKYLR